MKEVEKRASLAQLRHQPPTLQGNEPQDVLVRSCCQEPRRQVRWGQVEDSCTDKWGTTKRQVEDKWDASEKQVGEKG